MDWKDGETQCASNDVDIEDSSDDSDESSDMDLGEFVKCLFCDEMHKNPFHCLLHCQKEHNFDLNGLQKLKAFDTYDYLKLINYIRANKPEPSVFRNVTEFFWNDDKYLKPYDVNDPFLWYESWDASAKSELKDEVTSTDDEILPKYANLENGKITISENHFKEIQSTVVEFQAKINSQNEQIKALIGLLTDTEPVDRTVISMKENEDSPYFNSYSYASIHTDMLKDSPRMTAFHTLFKQNVPFFTNKLVLDLGCGSGILCLMAASAGAKEVWGVDESNIIYNAIDIIKENGQEKKINLIKGKLETLTSAIPKFDVIISEWMGYFLLFEGMVDSIIYARKNFLNPGGVVLPSKASLLMCGINDKARWESNIGFWDDVCGYKMASMRALNAQEPQIDIILPEDIITNTEILLELDLNHCDYEDINFSKDFIFTAKDNGEITSLVGFFTVDFLTPNPISLKTDPSSEPTHWKQTIFHLKEAIKVTKGQSVEGNILCSKHSHNPRSLNITIKLENCTNKYIMF